MSIVSEAQETFIEYSSKEYNPDWIKVDDIHNLPGQGRAMITLTFKDAKDNIISCVFPELFSPTENHFFNIY